MTQPILLSILIPTVVGREEQLNNLLKKLKGSKSWKEVKMVGDKYERHLLECFSLPVVIQVYKDDKIVTIGEKREDMYKNSQSVYSQMTDDDDELAPNAIEIILNAIKENSNIPCITFRERCMMNGEYKSSNHSIKYESWKDNFDGYDYTRCPFYKDVIRTDIAKSVPFPKIRYNEDEQWSMAIKPFLTDEVHLDTEIYYYIYNETDHNLRYGISL